MRDIVFSFLDSLLEVLFECDDFVLDVVNDSGNDIEGLDSLLGLHVVDVLLLLAPLILHLEVFLASLELDGVVLALALGLLDDALVVEDALFEVLSLILECILLVDKVGEELLPVRGLLILDGLILGLALDDLDSQVGEQLEHFLGRILILFGGELRHHRQDGLEQ